MWQQPLWGGSDLFEPCRRGRPDHQRHGHQPGVLRRHRPRASRARPSARPTPISSPSAAATTPGRCGSPPTSRAPTAPSTLRTESVDYADQHQRISRSTGSPDGPADQARPSRLSVSIRRTVNLQLSRLLRGLSRPPRARTGRAGSTSNIRLRLDFLPKSSGASATSTATPAARGRSTLLQLPNNRGVFNIPITARAARLPAVQLGLPRATTTSRSRRPGWRRLSSSVWNNITDLRQFNIDQHVPCDGSGLVNGPTADRSAARASRSTRRRSAGYGQVNYDFDLGSVNVDGRSACAWSTPRTISRNAVRAPSGPLPDADRAFTQQLYRLAAQREHATFASGPSGSCAWRRPRRGRGRCSSNSIRH